MKTEVFENDEAWLVTHIVPIDSYGYSVAKEKCSFLEYSYYIAAKMAENVLNNCCPAAKHDDNWVLDHSILSAT